MKKKFVSLLLALIVLIFVLSSCETPSGADAPNPFSDRFVECDAGDWRAVIVDKTTGVCYLWRWSGNRAGLTVLLDKDGTPLLYEEAWYQAFGEATNAE